MSWAEDEGYDAWSGDIPRSSPRCRRCGEKDLVWEKDGTRWRLYTLGGKVHECPRRDAEQDFKRYIRKETK
jgi:hypothetical protein